MTISPKIWTFPAFAISKQLFHVPGLANEGGFTAGGARIISPDVGGFGALEVQPSLQAREWEYPLTSWLMSKLGGHVLRIRLAPTPQVVSKRTLGLSDVNWDEDIAWSNDAPWEGDLTAIYGAIALRGSTQLTVDMSAYGQVLRIGHVIGHGFVTYTIEEIEYNIDDVATMRVTPPLRQNVAIGDQVFFRPYFTGIISNGGEVRTTYDASNQGLIEPGMIIMNEAIVP